VARTGLRSTSRQNSTRTRAGTSPVSFGSPTMLLLSRLRKTLEKSGCLHMKRRMLRAQELHVEIKKCPCRGHLECGM